MSSNSQLNQACSTATIAIFCSVIDNFGDAGVCLRLARQLVSEYRVAVCLITDDFAAFLKIGVPLDLQTDYQTGCGIQFLSWHSDLCQRLLTAVDAVIEAFGCRLPDHVLTAFSQCSHKPLLVNLEYLSAEAWVENFHGLSSLDATLGMHRHFFFPGFAPTTGGLLREHNLLENRDAFQLNNGRDRFFAEIGIVSTGKVDKNTTIISLFCYPHAPVYELFSALTSTGSPILCLVPEGVATDALTRFIGEVPSLGTAFLRGNLTIEVIPFMSQNQYDCLLWACDINFVRGEDSFVRAQWARRPAIWQIYPQPDNAHVAKLDAFIDLYSASASPILQEKLRTLFHAWNGNADFDLASQHWQALPDASKQIDWKQHAVAWSASMATQTDLATNLLRYIRKFS